MKTIVATIALIALCSTALSAADWPGFRGPNQDGISPEKGIKKNWQQEPPKLLWKASLGDDGYAGPAAYKGKVYIIDHKGANDIIRGFDISTGKEVWSYIYPDATSSNYGFTRSTPALADDKIYVISRLGLVGVVDLATSNSPWAWNMVKDFGGRKPEWDYAGSPLLDGKKLIIVPGGTDAGVVALDRSTGKVLWKAGTDAPGYSTPVKAKIQGVVQYVVFTAGGVGGYDAATGKPLWFVGWKTSYNVNAAQPIVVGNTVYISSGYGVGCGLVEIDADMNAKLRWKNKAIQAQFNSAVYLNGYIFGIGDPGNLVCLDPASGSILWSKEGFQKGPVIAVDGVLIALDGAGGSLAMVAADSSAYKELGRFSGLGGESWTTPIVADGKLIVRNKQTLACFSLK